MDMESAKAANINAVGVECGYISRYELEKCTNLIKTNALEAVRAIVSYNI